MITDDLKGKCVIVVAKNIGVFMGEYAMMENITCKLLNARWIWFWAGAASLDDLAVNGTNEPEMCRFPPVQEFKYIFNVVQIMPITEKAKLSLYAVPEWTGYMKKEGEK